MKNSQFSTKLFALILSRITSCSKSRGEAPYWTPGISLFSIHWPIIAWIMNLDDHFPDDQQTCSTTSAQTAAESPSEVINLLSECSSSVRWKRALLKGQQHNLYWTLWLDTWPPSHWTWPGEMSLLHYTNLSHGGCGEGVESSRGLRGGRIRRKWSIWPNTTPRRRSCQLSL